MLKNRLLLVSLILGLSFLPIYGEEVLSDVQFPKSPAYRVGISELPEKQYVQVKEVRTKAEAVFTDLTDSNLTDLTYADLSIKKLSKEIAQELEFEEQDMISDLSLLWQGAAVQSDTINFALYKLANPDADKPDEKSVKNVLKTIASMSTLVGASMGSPIIAGSSLIGGNIFGIMSQDTKALNYKYTRVNDADMIILIRKVEDLQQRAVDLYYDYMSAKKQLEFANDLVEDRKYKFELAQKNNAARELIVITDAYYRTSLDKQRTAKSEFFSKRAALEQFVGHDTFLQFEAELIARENGETTKNVAPAVNSQLQDEEYKKTVEDVKTYTDNINSKVEDVNNNELQIRNEKEVVQDDLPLESLDKVEQQNLPDKNKSFKFWKNENRVQKQKNVKFEEADDKFKNADDNISTGDLQPLEPVTSQDYMNTVRNVENELNANDYNTYDFSEAEKRGIKYFNDPMYGGVTGLAASVEETSSKKSLFSGFRKHKSDKVENPEPPEKPEKKGKEKVDPKSTKNLIFLHGEDKQTAKARFNFNINGRELEPEQGTQTEVKRKNVQAKKSNEFNFLPLDEIRTPDLTGDGYSIHSEYMY